MEIFILLGLVLLNGVFAMSEIALVAARRAKLLKAAQEGNPGASAALVLGEDPTRFLSTVQIGITSIGLLTGIVGESVLAAPLARVLEESGMAPHPAGMLATALVVVVVTYVSIVVGELVPKRIGQLNPEAIASVLARPLRVLAKVARPFVMLLTSSTNGVIRLLGVHAPAHASDPGEEIQAMLREGSEAGVIEPQQHTMVRNVLRLEDRKLGSLMIPRSDMVCLNASDPADKNLGRMTASRHARFPLCEGDLDHLIGVVSAKDVLRVIASGAPLDLRALAQPCVFVPETLTGMELLGQFKASHIQLAFVVDEYGVLQGLVTSKDLFEAVTGEFVAHDADEAWAVQREDGSWLLDGAIPVVDLKDHLGLSSVPEEDRGRYHTLGGMLMLLLERVPSTGDAAEWEGWRLEVVDMDGKRIDKVLASPVAPPRPA
jgi:putative hemolysin